MMEMEDIKRVQLSEIVELITKGTTPTTLGYEFQDEGVNFLKIECFDENGGSIESKVAHISEECHKKMKRSQLKNGDILFSIAGAIGRVAIVTEEMLPANINQALAIIRISDEQVYLPYIKLILTSPIVIEQFERKKQGVAQLNLSLKDINEISIPLPGKDKQIELAELFNKVVGVISKRNKELSVLDDLIKARFVEMFGDPVHSDKYGTRKLSSCVAEKTDMVDGPFGSQVNTKIDYIAKGEIPVIRTVNVKKMSFSPVDLKYMTRKKYETVIRSQVLPGDVILTKVGTIGNVCVFPDTYKEAVLSTTGSCRIRVDNSIVNTEFFAYNLLYLKSKLLEIASAGVQPFLNMNHVKNIDILNVPLGKQTKFADFVHQVDKSKVAVQKALDETQMLFDSLMQKYFG